MPRISVIVPVYNVEKYIHQCIDSILAQTFTDFELILVDDGSPDHCGEICDMYAAFDKRIKVIHQENKGLSGARNAGLEIMQGEYVTFVDSDDYIHSWALELFLTNVEKFGADICVSHFAKFGTDTCEYEPIPRDLLAEKTKMTSGRKACRFLGTSKGVTYTTAWGKLYRSTLWADIRFPEGRIHEDEATTYKLLYKSKIVVELEYELYFYRQNPNGIMAKFTVQRYDRVKALEERAKFYRAQSEDELASQAELMSRKEIAALSIRARNAGIYEQVPKQYRMSKGRALYLLHKYCGSEYFEWCLSMAYPVLNRYYEWLHKLLQMLHTE